MEEGKDSDSLDISNLSVDPQKKFEKKKHTTFEDTLIGSLESICSIFDNVYFAKSLGIISERNVLYRHLNKGNWGSKLWLVTLLLSARKSFSNLIRNMKIREKLKKEIQELHKTNKVLISEVLREKYMTALSMCNSQVKDIVFELLQTIAYLVIVIIDVCKINLSKKWRSLLEPLANIITIVRFFTGGSSAAYI